ncbi:hypothetical protein OH77DRAFT_1419070 [Trametes cingulata]|nr:hypothetical protein OH77DRAFT_1419070 [Trametes cingulata]
MQFSIKLLLSLSIFAAAAAAAAVVRDLRTLLPPAAILARAPCTESHVLRRSRSQRPGQRLWRSSRRDCAQPGRLPGFIVQVLYPPKHRGSDQS